MAIWTCNSECCYNLVPGPLAYCELCSGHLGVSEETFADKVYQNAKTMEARIVSLESDVKRLKRELGLK